MVGHRWLPVVALCALTATCGSAVGSTGEPGTAGGGPAGTPTTTSAGSPTSAPEIDGDDRAAAAVHRIIAPACGTGIEAIGTGVAVTPELIATVAHTFERAASIHLERPGPGDDDRVRTDADLVYLDPARDLALLVVADADDGPPLPHLELGAPTDGEAVAVWTAAAGPIEAKPAVVIRQVEVTLDGEGRREGLELDADIERGDSGAPVVTPGGAVVGVVFAADRVDPRAWAVAAAEIEAALAEAEGDPIPLAC